MKHMKKTFIFGAILSCAVFLGMKFYDSYTSINAEGNYTLKGKPNTYHETIATNTSSTGGDYMLKGEPNTYHETIATNTSDIGGDYILKGELNIYHETFSAISDDSNSYNSEGMHSGDVVIAEPTPLPKQ